MRAVLVEAAIGLLEAATGLVGTVRVEVVGKEVVEGRVPVRVPLLVVVEGRVPARVVVPPLAQGTYRPPTKHRDWCNLR